MALPFGYAQFHKSWLEDMPGSPTSKSNVHSLPYRSMDNIKYNLRKQLELKGFGQTNGGDQTSRFGNSKTHPLLHELYQKKVRSRGPKVTTSGDIFSVKGTSHYIQGIHYDPRSRDEVSPSILVNTREEEFLPEIQLIQKRQWEIARPHSCYNSTLKTPSTPEPPGLSDQRPHSTDGRTTLVHLFRLKKAHDLKCATKANQTPMTDPNSSLKCCKIKPGSRQGKSFFITEGEDTQILEDLAKDGPQTNWGLSHSNVPPSSPSVVQGGDKHK